MVPSITVALGLLTGAFLLLLAALYVVVRGAGRISLIRQEQDRLEAKLENIDTRITREVKTRAGLTRAERAEEDRSIGEQAQDLLRQAPPPSLVAERPKRPIRRF